MLLLHLLIEMPGCSLGYGKALPILITYHFADIYDLTHMMGIMGQLPVDRVNGEERLMADMDGLQQIFFFQGSERIQQAGPTLFPKLQQLFPPKTRTTE